MRRFYQAVALIAHMALAAGFWAHTTTDLPSIGLGATVLSILFIFHCHHLADS